MGKYYIQVPIWATKSVGIAGGNLNGKVMDIEILYKDKAGNRIYPNVYRMATSQIRKYPTRSFGNTPPLHIVPISAFDEIIEPELTQDQKDYKEYCEREGIPFNKNNA